MLIYCCPITKVRHQYTTGLTRVNKRKTENVVLAALHIHHGRHGQLQEDAEARFLCLCRTIHIW